MTGKMKVLCNNKKCPFKICYSIWIYQSWEKKFDQAGDEGGKANFGLLISFFFLIMDVDIIWPLEALSSKFSSTKTSCISNNCIAVTTAVVFLSSIWLYYLLLFKRISLSLCKQFCLGGMYSHNLCRGRFLNMCLL